MSYSVETLHGCTLVFGSLPITKMTEFLGQYPNDAVMDYRLSSQLGASMIIGTPDQLEALGDDDVIQERIKARIVEKAHGVTLSAAANTWLLNGERGASSNSIFYQMTGVPADEDCFGDYPVDGSDLRRCRLLLEQVPEFAPRIQEMANVSKHWKGLIGVWDELLATMDEEAPEWRQRKGKTPRTYEMIQKALGYSN